MSTTGNRLIAILEDDTFPTRVRNAILALVGEGGGGGGGIQTIAGYGGDAAGNISANELAALAGSGRVGPTYVDGPGGESPQAVRVTRGGPVIVVDVALPGTEEPIDWPSMIPSWALPSDAQITTSAYTSGSNGPLLVVTAEGALQAFAPTTQAAVAQFVYVTGAPFPLG